MSKKDESPIIDLVSVAPETVVEQVPQTETAIPEGAGAPQEATNPYRIFVSFFAGKKPATRILQTQFDDIETEAQLAGVVNFLHNETGKPIEIINWRALEG